MSPLRKAALAACLAVLAGTRIPAAQPWTAVAAAALAGLLALATLALPWRPAARLHKAILPAAVGLAVLPADPAAALALLPWPVQAAALVAFLHLAFPAPAAPASHAAGAQRPLRWIVPAALLVAAVAAPLVLPLALPAPVAALQELRPIGAAVVAGLALALAVVAAGLLLRGLPRAGPDPAGEEGPA